MITKNNSMEKGTLSDSELERYSRQIIIPAIGREGQEKIKCSRVFVAGTGGLGSVSTYYLAAAGVGHITIVDRDRVEMGNLNRQIIHNTDDIGIPKVESAAKKIKSLNPHCNITPIQEEMTSENILRLVGDCSIIVDATDNLATRRILNHASLEKKIPFIFGGVDGFEGMTTTFVPPETPCFECLFASAPEKKSKIGVVGPLPGMVASIQAAEALKLILGMDGLLKGRLLFVSGTDMTFREIRIEKNPACKVCNSAMENGK